MKTKTKKVVSPAIASPASPFKRGAIVVMWKHSPNGNKIVRRKNTPSLPSARWEIIK